MTAQPKTYPALISAEVRPASGAWASEARADAAARLVEMGLPTRRDEYWKWTRPDSLTSALPETAEVFDYEGEPPVFHDIDRLKVIFVDGVFDAEASDVLEGEGIEIERLSEAGREGHPLGERSVWCA